jgi:hypothetical protein
MHFETLRKNAINFVLITKIIPLSGMMSFERMLDEFFIELWGKVTDKCDGDTDHREGF